MQNKHFIPLCLFLLASVALSTAQTSTDSPYSRFGYGQLSDAAFGSSRSLGGAAIGLRRNDQINPFNPASYSAIDSTTFLFDFGATLQQGTFKEGANKETKPNGNLDHLAIQFPLIKGMGASAGLIPYSSVGYQFGNTISSGSLTGTATYSGDGGLSQAYFGLAVSPFKGISLGANFNYLFGNIDHISTISNDNGASSVTKINHLHARALKMDYGLQLFRSLGKDESLTLGFTFSPKVTLNSTYDSINYIGTTGDTTRLSKKYELAQTIGFGADWHINKHWDVVADGLYQKWSDARFANTLAVLSDRIKLSAGAEFTPNLNSRSYYQHVKYRFGGFYANNYSNIANQKVKEYGVGFGFGLPFKGSRSVLNISFDYSKKVPENALLIKEDYLRLTLNLTLNEYWFFKRKFD